MNFDRVTCFLGILIFLKSPLSAQTINASGGPWSINIPQITEAGSDYLGTYESSTDLISLSGSFDKTFLGLLTSNKVNFNVHYESNNDNIHFFAKSSGGIAKKYSAICLLGCSANINHANSYIKIPKSISSLQETINLFNIHFPLTVLEILSSAQYSNINIQLKISGISVVLPATSYSSTIFFTISPG